MLAGMPLPIGNTVGRDGQERAQRAPTLREHGAYRQDGADAEPQSVDIAGEHDTSDLSASEELAGRLSGNRVFNSR